jgi:hypothetical protein
MVLTRAIAPASERGGGDNAAGSEPDDTGPVSGGRDAIDGDAITTG